MWVDYRRSVGCFKQDVIVRDKTDFTEAVSLEILCVQSCCSIHLIRHIYVTFIVQMDGEATLVPHSADHLMGVEHPLAVDGWTVGPDDGCLLLATWFI